MSDWAMIWWAWLSVSLVLGIIEILAPGFIFLGFALGALAMSVIVGLAPALLDGLSMPALLALFAALSLLSWIGLKVTFKRQTSTAQTFTDDVND